MNAFIIDDNADIRMLLDGVLSMIGIDPMQAPGGREALETFEAMTVPPDLIILDVQMPVMDGWTTLEAIRALPLTKDAPVILCTVKASAQDILRGWELGCDAYVSKPFDVRALMRTVREVASRTVAERNEARALEVIEARRAAVLAAAGR